LWTESFHCAFAPLRKTHFVSGISAYRPDFPQSRKGRKEDGQSLIASPFLLDPQRDFGKNSDRINSVEEPPVHTTQRKKEWRLTTPAFQQLLDWLDQGVSSEGRSYLELRKRLVAYFDRKNCGAPDELADETLNRVARRLEEEGAIVSETAARYCYIVARFVFLEYLRGRNDEISLDEVTNLSTGNDPVASGPDDERLNRERLLTCLDQCTEKLEPANRDLIIRYYHGEQRIKIENRRALATELSVSVNALSIRACRIRDKLEDCVSECAGQA
jgi:DNA-directed RNA polymerase specialized sigma24 family protein